MPSKHRQVTFLFEEAGNLDKNTLGGKGHGLVEMSRLGMPIPPGFIVLTGVSRAFSQERALPKRLDWQLERCVRKLEKETGKTFGGSKSPLLVSVRSGAKVSMPGMMDTVLNLGLNEESVRGLVWETGDDRFAYDTYRRFLESFGSTVLSIQKSEFANAYQSTMEDHYATSDFEMSDQALKEVCAKYRKIMVSYVGRMIDDPWEQLSLAISAVCRSWQSERAISYRAAHKIPHNWGTAVVVQSMVFGNLGNDSGTGVVFSRNVATGASGLYGEYLPNAQGEDVVAGVRTPMTIDSLKSENREAYDQLNTIVIKLENHHNDVVDVEFTIEHGQLYLLQSRVAKRTPIAAVNIAVDMVSEGRISKEIAVSRVNESDLDAISKPQFDPIALKAASSMLFAKGISASGGAATGHAIFCPRRAQELAKDGVSVILFREETSPDDFAGMLAASAIVTSRGGATSHAAVVARGLGRPAVVGAHAMSIEYNRAYSEGKKIEEGDIVSVDGNTGAIVIGEVLMVQGQLSDKVKTFLDWRNELAPSTTIDRSLMEKYYNVNTFLNDFYISDALRHAADSHNKNEATTLHNKIARNVANVFATYLLGAVAGELRHAWSRCINQSAENLAKIEQYGVKRFDTRGDVQVSVVNEISGRSTEELIDFVKTGVYMFQNANWSGSYGGPLWGNIAETLLLYLQKKINVDLFVDRVFDLRHNSGRVFNKHRMVMQDTNESVLGWQLDTKRNHNGTAKELAKSLRKFHFEISDEVAQLCAKMSVI